MAERGAAPDRRFRLEEATIAELHAAIRDGRTTVAAVVERYIARARAGMAQALGKATFFVVPKGKASPIPTRLRREIMLSKLTLITTDWTRPKCPQPTLARPGRRRRRSTHC